MMQKSTFVLLLAALLIGAGIGIAGMRAAAPADAKVAKAAAAEVAKPAPAPAAPASYTSPTIAAGVPPALAAPRHQDPDAALLEQIQNLDTKFQAEPIVPAWAMEQEQMIAASFAPEALKLAAAPAPLSHEESCRSKTCRINVIYRNELDAQVAQLNLLGAISSSLSHATFGQISGADGSVQLIMYARAGRKAPPHPEEH
jgi:hypothetical protein